MNTATDFLSLRDFTPFQLRELLDLAADIKASPKTYADALKGKTLAMIFEKPSLRTRVSFDVGIQQLGGFSVYLSPTEINMGRRESVHDVAKNLERMVQGIMIRTFAHEIVEQLAAFASVPVINGLSDFSHPCQAMADYLTMFEVKGRIAGLKVAYVGDGNNVANSLLFAGVRFGAHVTVATPPGYEPRPDVIEVFYYCLVSGFQGKLVEDPRGMHMPFSPFPCLKIIFKIGISPAHGHDVFNRPFRQHCPAKVRMEDNARSVYHRLQAV